MENKLSEKLKIEKSKKKEKWKLFGTCEEDKEKDLITSPNIEISGNKEIVIDGCEGVVEYSDTYIKIKLKKGVMILYGNNLNIICFENSLITLKGKIETLEFC